jgi:hypothetical protein
VAQDYCFLVVRYSELNKSPSATAQTRIRTSEGQADFEAQAGKFYTFERHTSAHTPTHVDLKVVEAGNPDAPVGE